MNSARSWGAPAACVHKPALAPTAAYRLTLEATASCTFIDPHVAPSLLNSDSWLVITTSSGLLPAPNTTANSDVGEYAPPTTAPAPPKIDPPPGAAPSPFPTRRAAHAPPAPTRAPAWPTA